MLEMFGHPVRNGAYRPDGQCTPPDVQAFTRLLETRNAGPFRATGIKPALDSLKEVFARVKSEVPELHEILGTAGMHCARFTKIKRPDGTIRIGPGISNHTFGTAIDVKLDGNLDPQGNNTTQRGLLVLSTYFNSAGWYWGAAFPVEDAMHFEASRSLLAKWRRDGLI